jgi:hypothetical protein
MMDFLKLGQIALTRGDYQEAVNIFRRALEKQRGVAAFLGLGQALYRLGDLPASRWAFGKALDHAPHNVEARKWMRAVESEKAPAPKRQRSAPFKISGGRFTVRRHGRARPFFIKGVNLGLGLPGSFPGEFAVKKGTYRRWFDEMTELGVNVVRIYTVHPPAFYEALALFNEAAPRKLFLVQGVWAELPPKSEFSDRAYEAALTRDMRDAVDVLYGNARLPERRGRAQGDYAWDVSPYACAHLVGREWEGCAVKQYNEAAGGKEDDFTGSFLRIRRGSPFERWATRMCDTLQSYEQERYGGTRPVSFVNWPTLDPLEHPSEADQEREALLQGQRLPAGVCNENEDSVTVDAAKVEVLRGAGFYATYHAYPYYPDFMNHDYEAERDPYLAYLSLIKRHHRDQPVLIAEFGVPSSRDAAHWHRLGWHQGSHSEARQGEINGLLMRSIHRAGLAGGVLFSWFDEWFKRNWVFSPYEEPAERSPLWFNFQNPEQNYGLIGAYPGYPGRTVSLAGRAGEWTDAVVLYEKSPDDLHHRFGDNGDGARTLRRLRVQHDEGFLYVLLETAGPVDFAAARYVLGLSTAGTELGERLMPFRTRFHSPRPLTFLLLLAGREGSRVLVAHEYDKYLNHEKGVIRPGASDQGQWVVMLNRTNVRRISKDGLRFFPSRVFSMSGLRFGSLDRDHGDYDSRADFFVSGSMIELRIPWGLINVADPSSKRIVWIEQGVRTRPLDGIGFLALSYKPGPGGLAAATTGNPHHAADTLPAAPRPGAVREYVWEGWDTPVFHLYRKESCERYHAALAAIPEKD